MNSDIEYLIKWLYKPGKSKQKKWEIENNRYEVLTVMEKKKRNMNQKSLDNLKPYPKGISGNPSGMRKIPQELINYFCEVGNTQNTETEYNYTGEYDEDGYEEYTTEDVLTDQTWRYEVIEEIWKKAKDGHLGFIQLLAYMGALNPTEMDLEYIKSQKEEMLEKYSKNDENELNS